MPASRHGTSHTLLFSTCPLARPAPPLRRGLVHVVEVRLWRIAPRRGLSLSADKTTQHHSTRGASVAPSLCPKARARSATLQRIVVVGALEGAGRVFVGGTRRSQIHAPKPIPPRSISTLSRLHPSAEGRMARPFTHPVHPSADLHHAPPGSTNRARFVASSALSLLTKPFLLRPHMWPPPLPVHACLTLLSLCLSVCLSVSLS